MVHHLSRHIRRQTMEGVYHPFHHASCCHRKALTTEMLPYGKKPKKSFDCKN